MERRYLASECLKRTYLKFPTNHPLYNVAEILYNNKRAACYVISKRRSEVRDVFCFMWLQKISDYTQRNVTSCHGNKFQVWLQLRELAGSIQSQCTEDNISSYLKGNNVISDSSGYSEGETTVEILLPFLLERTVVHV